MLNNTFIKLPTDDVTEIAQELAFDHIAWTDSNFKYPRDIDKNNMVALIAQRFVRQARDKFCDIATNVDHADKLARVFFMTYAYYDMQYQLMNKVSIESFVYLITEMVRLGIEPDPFRLTSSLTTLNKHRTRYDEYGNAYSYTYDETA